MQHLGSADDGPARLCPIRALAHVRRALRVYPRRARCWLYHGHVLSAPAWQGVHGVGDRSPLWHFGHASFRRLHCQLEALALCVLVAGSPEWVFGVVMQVSLVRRSESRSNSGL